MPKLQDYSIYSAGRFPCIGSNACFRARDKHTGLPVLLHRYRPAELLLDREPLVDGSEPPNFDEPFVTRFTGVFTVAGSAWLIEPLPDCVTAEDTWRTILQRTPLLVSSCRRSLLNQVMQATAQIDCQEIVELAQVVLTAKGRYGVLAGHLRCADGFLQVRPSSSERGMSLSEELEQFERDLTRHHVPAGMKGVKIPC